MNNVIVAREANVGSAERTISLAAGSLIALVALRRSLGPLSLAAIGGYLIYRGMSGRCPLYDALGVSTVAEPHREHTAHVERMVDKAVEDTFPASDPPGYTAGSMFTQVSE